MPRSEGATTLISLSGGSMARLKAARATSTMSAVGSAVVMCCKARPGARTARASHPSEAAAALSTS